MASTIDPTLGGNLTTQGVRPRKSAMQSELTKARDEISDVQATALQANDLVFSNITGQIVNAQYGDETISTGKLQLQAVTGARIADETLGGIKIVPGTIGNIRLSDMAAGTIKGRTEGTGAGTPNDLTADNVHVILRFARTATLPSALTGSDSGRVFRVSATGTTTVPVGGTLGVGFHCTIVNPAGSGFTRTIDGPGATNPTVAAGETATINVLDNGAVTFSKGPGQVL